MGPLKVDGWLAFYKKDNTFGDGIKGHVEATFPLLKVEATAQFGNVNDYNYWYIDACAEFPTAIPVVGVIGIKGLSSFRLNTIRCGSFVGSHQQHPEHSCGSYESRCSAPTPSW